MYNIYMTTAYAFVPSPQHTYPDHPERPGRLDELIPRLDSVQAEQLEAAHLPNMKTLTRVHVPHLISGLERVCREQAPGIIDYAPTFVTQTSFEDAMLAAGATLACSRAVSARRIRTMPFAIVRPPGHHAEPDKAMGFCLFNNVAVAAKDALAHGLERVLVVDYDAHHGNGTQAAFLNDERAGLSLDTSMGHLSRHRLDRGRATRQETHRQCAPARSSGRSGLCAYYGRNHPTAVEAFRPEMILVSAGFDAHWNDPITSLGLSSAGFFNIFESGWWNWPGNIAAGRSSFVLEGGYDPTNVANGAEAVFEALAGTSAGV